MKKANNNKGYSLTELLIVVVVLGILSSLAIITVGSLLNHQAAVTCHVNQQTLYQIITNYPYKIRELKKDKSFQEKYSDENNDEFYKNNDNCPFLKGKSVYNSKEDNYEDVFRQSFIDQLNAGNFDSRCSKSGNYYVVDWNDGDVQIYCYNDKGILTDEHNNSTVF